MYKLKVDTNFGRHYLVAGSTVWVTVLDSKELLHREDGPAVIHPDGTECWYLRGKLHRIGGPAIIEPDGTEIWCFEDQYHRDDGPAVIKKDGTQEWWMNGVHQKRPKRKITETGK